MNSDFISDGAKKLLLEVVSNESNNNYWEEKFTGLSHKEDSLLRGYFKELIDAQLLKVFWADNYPYFIEVLGKGYLYEQQIHEEEKLAMSKFERELSELLERAKTIKSPINIATTSVNFEEDKRPSDEWINDVEIFYNKYLTKHALGQKIKSLLFHRTINSFSELRSCLISVSKDQDFIDMISGGTTQEVPTYQARTLPEYDVFLSHANADKLEFVDELNNSLTQLGVKIFYDKNALEWGDDWKARILDGIKKAEFAIIVISENFFDREWTERELKELLNRQNRNGQKLILPILHGITIDDLKKKYPSVADIQAISSKNYTCDQIALLFARQLIRRLKNI